MKNILLAMFFFCITSPLLAVEFKYTGKWKTTNRKLDGTQTAIVTYLGEKEGVGQWKGRFFGVWQGVSYDYNVKFSGPKDNLRGEAVIDGAQYYWAAIISPKVFKANFNGSRYVGSFDMKRAKE